MNLVDELHGIVDALVRSGVAHAVCGGVAVTAYGATRSTKDIDVLVALDDLPRALEAVQPLGYTLAALPLVFDEGAEKERHVQRVSKIKDGEHLVLERNPHWSEATLPFPPRSNQYVPAVTRRAPPAMKASRRR